MRWLSIPHTIVMENILAALVSHIFLTFQELVGFDYCLEIHSHICITKLVDKDGQSVGVEGQYLDVFLLV